MANAAASVGSRNHLARWHQSGCKAEIPEAFFVPRVFGKHTNLGSESAVQGCTVLGHRVEGSIRFTFLLYSISSQKR